MAREGSGSRWSRGVARWRNRGKEATQQGVAETFVIRPNLLLEKVPLRQWVSIPCEGQLTEQSGSVDIIAAAYTHPQMVSFICSGLQFGPSVPVTYTQKSTGYSFSGSVPFCFAPTPGQMCSGGGYMTTLTSITGEIDTSKEPDALNFSYTVNLYCDQVLACVEEGSYKEGKKTEGTDILNASFKGNSSWTLKCCPERHSGPA
jgi:hypothetical protein